MSIVDDVHGIWPPKQEPLADRDPLASRAQREMAERFRPPGAAPKRQSLNDNYDPMLGVWIAVLGSL